MKVVAITGAAGGLGQGLTKAFLGEGWRVAGIWHRRKPGVVHENFFAFQADVTQAHEVANAVKAIGSIDALINNAGATRDKLVTHLSDDDWQHVLDVNLKGAALCSRAVLPLMSQEGGGHIINIGSYSGKVGAAGQANYAAAKAGLIGLIQSLSAEMGPMNICVNAVLPGVLETAMTAELSPQTMEAFARANALGRINSVEEVARFIVFLTSLRNVSGQIFQLDSRKSSWG